MGDCKGEKDKCNGGSLVTPPSMCSSAGFSVRAAAKEKVLSVKGR